MTNTRNSPQPTKRKRPSDDTPNSEQPSTTDTSSSPARPCDSTKQKHVDSTQHETTFSLSPSLLVILSVFLVSTIVFLLTRNQSSHQNFPTTPLSLTPQQLSVYNGIQNPSIYISIKGKIYDVSDAKHFYGPDASYSHFAGRDATRSLVSGCFQKGCRADLRDLSEKELEDIEEWVQFFDGKYRVVGEVVGYNAMEEREAL